jgi:hypothetical protein
MKGSTLKVEEQNSKSPSTKRRGFFSSSRNVSESDFPILASKMVQALTEDEKEHAARSAFKYLWQSVRGEVDNKEDSDFYAKSMAMRHLKSKKGNFEIALQKFRDAIQYRKNNDLDGLRLCFHADDLVLNEETSQRYALYRERLEDRMTSGRVYVQGYDKNGRAIYTIFAARTKDFDPEWFIKESLYNFERALACTERESGGIEESITIIGNYNGFLSKHAAPMSLSRTFMDSLRQNYPGRVKRVYLLNTPATFLLFWSIVSPFIGTETRKKIQFVNSEKQRQREFHELVSLDQATPWMLEGGKKTREFNVAEYVHETRFDHAFD